ncbi:MAG TPA: HPr(Ser) kinase/phosphatase [Polyangia bacterium]
MPTAARLPSLSVRNLLRSNPQLGLELMAGETGLDRHIGVPRIQKPGLALAGYISQVHPERVQVLGSTELGFLASLPPDRARSGIEGFLSAAPACVIITKGQTVPMDLLEIGNRATVPILRTHLTSSALIDGVERVMEYALAQLASVHGVLLDVLGVGVLLQGKSGMGKSEAALELIMRGFRLVADDLVEVRKIAGGVLVGFASELIKHHMEVRGLGIINIKDMFGVASVRDEKKIELVLELRRWDETEPPDRLGLDEMSFDILGVQVPMLRIPVSPGRNVSSLIEVAARNRLLQVRGHHSAREFQERLDQALAEARERRLREDVE